MKSIDSVATSAPTRYSLRTLLLLVAVLALPLAVCRWNVVAGICLAVFFAGGTCAVMGVRMHRKGITIVGILFAVGAALFAGWSAATVIAWVGAQKLDVHVLVVDASSLAPISGAQVQVLSGPSSSIEGPHPNVDEDFEIVEVASEPDALISDNRGSTTFTHRFHAAGSYGMFRDSGYVDTKRVWLRVSATGYITTILPLDRQSIRPRDIHDQTPLFVTVPVGKR